MFFSPLEQFQILPFFSFGITLFDFSITNAMITTFLGLGFFLFVHYCLSVYSFSCFPNRWQLLIEGLYLTTAGLIWDSIGTAGQKYFPFIFMIFSFILISNVSGLVLYSFTITSHLIQTMVLALSVFIGVVIIWASTHPWISYAKFVSSGWDFLSFSIFIGAYRNSFVHI